MKRTEDFVKQEIENKVALAVVESMTSEKVTTMVTDILNGSSGSSGWDRETFFEQILKTQLKNIIREAASKKLTEHRGDIEKVVTDVITPKVIEKMVEKIQVDLHSNLKVYIAG